MSGHEPAAPEEGAQILSFHRRPGAVPPATGTDRKGPDAVEDLSKYAHKDTADDYPHRMTVNIAALVFLAVLGLVGYWLADSMASMRKNQDCALTGRRNCASIDVPVRERY